MENLNIIKQNAEESRIWAENNCSPEELKKRLRGFCAIGASYLSNKLKEANIDNKIGLYYSTNSLSHCFVITDNYIIDITATQFNGNIIYNRKNELLNPIEIRHKSEINTKYLKFWEISHIINSPEELIKKQIDDSWNKDTLIDRNDAIKNSIFKPK